MSTSSPAAGLCRAWPLLAGFLAGAAVSWLIASSGPVAVERGAAVWAIVAVSGVAAVGAYLAARRLQPPVAPSLLAAGIVIAIASTLAPYLPDEGVAAAVVASLVFVVLPVASVASLAAAPRAHRPSVLASAAAGAAVAIAATMFATPLVVAQHIVIAGLGVVVAAVAIPLFERRAPAVFVVALVLVISPLGLYAVSTGQQAIFPPEIVSLPDPGPGPHAVRLEFVRDGISHPVALKSLPGGEGAVFVLEQTGRIMGFGPTFGESFVALDIRHRAAENYFEQGLLDIAFHPDVAENRMVFVSYTDHEGSSVLARYRLDPESPTQVLVDSEEILLNLTQPTNRHNGGRLAFGPDGYLYYAKGDGGLDGGPARHAQDPKTLYGSILRLDVDGETGYRIPPDNPYASGSRGRPEIWAIGLRNPWGLNFHPETGELFIVDVGETLAEEINVLPANARGGANFGWNVYEAYNRNRLDIPAPANAIFPVLAYGHDNGDCAIIGGHVYTGSLVPELQGTYLFGDYCSARVWGLRHDGTTWQVAPLAKFDGRLSGFGQDAAGESYVLDVHHGAILRITAGEGDFPSALAKRS